MSYDPILDGADESEQWCVYETACLSCGKKQVHVATTHAYENGYVEPTPLCKECVEGSVDIRGFASENGIDLGETS